MKEVKNTLKVERSTLKAQMASARTVLIRNTCQLLNWNIRKAAAQLGISRPGLYHLINTDPELHRAWKAARGETTNGHQDSRRKVSRARTRR